MRKMFTQRSEASDQLPKYVGVNWVCFIWGNLAGASECCLQLPNGHLQAQTITDTQHKDKRQQTQVAIWEIAIRWYEKYLQNKSGQTLEQVAQREHENSTPVVFQT